jgi:hypothetical protein
LATAGTLGGLIIEAAHGTAEQSIEPVVALLRKERPKTLNWRSSMSTTEAASKIFEEIAQLFGSGPTDEQILNFRPSADVVQRASKLLSLNRTVQMDDDLKHELDQYEQAELLMRMVKAQIRARQGS